jgi:hypothetical protein
MKIMNQFYLDESYIGQMVDIIYENSLIKVLKSLINSGTELERCTIQIDVSVLENGLIE